MDFWQQELLVPQAGIGSAEIECSQTDMMGLECLGFFFFFFLQAGIVSYSSETLNNRGKLKERWKISNERWKIKGKVEN